MLFGLQQNLSQTPGIRWGNSYWVTSAIAKV